ncbi:FHA and PRK00409 domain-containing protein [Phanerochaete sordida]|uniref:FHA and PRK00409 domain-containing protein n=1 Tax=Phanerochaete sordida TaxID=48140 RepID=A0A9P3G0H9_9APHY|nr:FHA and PRK00409 domain-containing protein [Phanerochaete sordida]
MPPFSNAQPPVPLPALYLYPLNDSFVPKHISLVSNQRVKIGRQTNAKTVPAERNGYFDSKVLSRQHAEVWEENGKIFIKDVKSSNGTFINGERLSPEGLESQPFELKTDDIVEFGIDIVGEDNTTIVHHKVAARVVCVFSEQDAQAAARAEAQQNPPTYGALGGQGPGMANQPGVQRRQTMQGGPGLVGMGGMGGSARPPGKSGLTFDHILSRLQGELQKSRETGAELHSLTNAMNDIHETLGGNIPPAAGPYPQTLPPVVPPQAQRPNDASAPAQASRSPDGSSSALNELQSQLHETQMSLASHMDKIRSLEGMLAEHDAIKREVSAMRELMEERKREMELLRLQTQSPTNLRRQRSRSEDDYASDDDDARSIATVVPHELERVDEEDEESLAADEEAERRHRQDELRPRTPEPTGMGMHEDDDEPSASSSHLRPQSPPAPVISDELAQRLSTLSNQLESALELSRSLQQQHATAQSTISLLESKVATLESLVQATQAQVQAQTETQQEIARSVEDVKTAVAAVPAAPALAKEESTQFITELVNQWTKKVEGRWSSVQEEWNEERERLRKAKEDWELQMKKMETSLESTSAKVDSGLASFASFQVQHHQAPNGHAKLGLVTPPSPRSLSAESTRPRTKKRRSSSSRGRSRSRSESPTRVNGGEHDEASSTSSRLRHRASWDSDDAAHGNGSAKSMDGSEPISGRLPAALTEARAKEPPKDVHPLNNMQTMFGVIVVVAAAAAVMWRVKPDGS